jgi:hypothetical protein
LFIARFVGTWEYLCGDSSTIAEKSGKARTRRPVRIERSFALGQADHYRIVLHQFWPKLGPRLLVAQSAKDIVSAVREDAAGIIGSLLPFSELILKILRDPKFPRARSKSQIHFLADSLGGQGFVTVAPIQRNRRGREKQSEARHCSTGVLH